MVLSSVIAIILAPVIGSLFLQGAAAGVAAGNAEAAAMGFFGMIAGMMLTLPVVMFLYFLVEAFTGASLGKMILGLKIGNADGTQAELKTFLVRYAIKQSGSLLALLGALTGLGFFGTLGTIASLAIFVGCFFVLAEKKQAFQDMIANTAVFKKTDLA